MRTLKEISAQQSLFQVIPGGRSSRADVRRLAYIGKRPDQKAGQSERDSDSWFTPPEYIDSVKAVLGGIDLDPFSSQKANEIVCADNFMSTEYSAFEYAWAVGKKTTVFMNPPYSSGLCSRAIGRFVEQYEAGNVSEAIILVNNATDTRWFRALVEVCDAICFTDHRISFWNADGKQLSGNTRGQAFFYFGRKKARFSKVFRKHGFVLIPNGRRSAK